MCHAKNTQDEASFWDGIRKYTPGKQNLFELVQMQAASVSFREVHTTIITL